MGKSSSDLRGKWVAYIFCLAAGAAGCASQTPVSENVAVDDYSDALSADQFACERTKRECLVAADCAADKREACESAFRSCEQPLKDEKKALHDKCHAEKETCEAAAKDEAARQACHTAEHKCTLPLDPPEAVCRIEAEACVAAAKAAAGTAGAPAAAGAPAPGPGPKSAAEEACREKERACRDEKHLKPEDLPMPPKCAPAGRADCVPAAPTAPTAPAVPATGPADMSTDHVACERTKRECLIAADCAADKREACESAFRACEEPIRAEKKRVSDKCREDKETCEAAATDEAGKHACHIAEHRCKLPVEPADAVCRIDAEECVWAARVKNGTATTTPEPKMPPEPKEPKPAPSPEEQACRDTEHTCVESKRVKPDELPKPPHCPPAPPVCKPAPTK